MNPALSEATRALVPRLLDFIAQDGCDDAQFDSLALALFAHQYERNEAYRRFCQRRGMTPRKAAGWRDIPAVPISAFKDATLSCEPTEACERVFMTSGTTRAEVRARHFHPTIAVWDASMRREFARRFMRGAARLPMAILFPPETELGNSSLARYLAQAVREFGDAQRSAWFVGQASGLDGDGLRAWLRAAQDRGEPVAVLGASASFVHLADGLDAAGESFALPAGSRVLDTGGYKRASRELPPDAFYDMLARVLGVPRVDCVNMYGMTELSSQFYDAGNAVSPAPKAGGHWIRSRIVDPLTGRDMPEGERGILVHCDLASFNSATTILTEDVGLRAEGADDSFLLLGRAEGAQARGCSLAVDEFMRAAAP